MDKGNKSLVTAPIKRLMRVTFSDEGLQSSGSVNSAMSVRYTDRPKYIFSTDDIPKQTLTGRYSGEYYDVIHFKVAFVINTKDYLRVLKELCSAKEHKYIDSDKQTHTYKHNQITVLNSDLRSVDMRSQNHEYYRYGDDNVSVLELTCEYLFNVKGYESMMPQAVSKIFTGGS